MIEDLSQRFTVSERQQFAQRGWLLLRGVPCEQDNAALLAIARSLGEVSMQSLPYRSGLVEADGVQRVEALMDAPLDQFEQPLRSGHHGAFPLHSDEAFLQRPCRYVLLHCWRADPCGGGESLLAWRTAIESAADMPLLQALRGREFAYPAGNASVIGPQLLRYNRAEVEGHARRTNRALDAAQREWLDRFDALFASAALSLSLAAEDLLLIDNHRVLHGRTAFAPGSPRMLKRVRVR